MAPHLDDNSRLDNSRLCNCHAIVSEERICCRSRELQSDHKYLTDARANYSLQCNKCVLAGSWSQLELQFQRVKFMILGGWRVHVCCSFFQPQPRLSASLKSKSATIAGVDNSKITLIFYNLAAFIMTFPCLHITFAHTIPSANISRHLSITSKSLSHVATLRITINSKRYIKL